MYIVIVANDEAYPSYVGFDYASAMNDLMVEVWRGCLEVLGTIPGCLPAPHEWKKLEEGPILYRDGDASMAVNAGGATIRKGSKQFLVRLKQALLLPDQLKEAADAYNDMLRAAVVYDRIDIRFPGVKLPPEEVQKAVAVYSDALDDGESEDSALEKLEKFLSGIDSDSKLVDLGKGE